MGTWHVPASVLATARFEVSPLAEVTGALGDLTHRTGDRAFLAAHAEAFERMLAEHPGRNAVATHHFRRGWLADFLSMPPPHPAASFSDELAAIAMLGDRRLRADLREATPSTLPRVLTRPGLTEHVVGLLDWIWTRTLASDWPRRERILRADIVSRTARLASGGWAAVLRDLGRDREWLAGDELRINRFDNPTRRLPRDAELTFVPVGHRANWVGWSLPNRYAVFYTVTGRLAPVAGSASPALHRLIGPNRAHLLRLLDTPASPTSLAARTGLPLGSVGAHLRVLLDCGLVLRRRSGREVLYWRTALGESLVAVA